VLDLSEISDDYYVNMVLQTELDLPQQRETLLHYFEQIQKRFSGNSRFFARDKGDHVLEEDREGGAYRWTSIEAKRLQSGFVNPDTVQMAIEQHENVLEIAPYALSLSYLDCESLSVIFGFDYHYSGNQSELIAEALGTPLALSSLIDQVGSGLVAYEPAIQFALGGDMQVQARLSFETHGNPFQQRDSESIAVGEDVLSVYLTVRRFEGFNRVGGFKEDLRQLISQATELLENHVVDGVLHPLRSAIRAK
jgi:hypothetical protein